jgi:hypothetical protein
VSGKSAKLSDLPDIKGLAGGDTPAPANPLQFGGHGHHRPHGVMVSAFLIGIAEFKFNNDLYIIKTPDSASLLCAYYPDRDDNGSI